MKHGKEKLFQIDREKKNRALISVTADIVHMLFTTPLNEASLPFSRSKTSRGIG